MEGRRAWSRVSHERSVERFYTHGVNHQTEIHGGFLNFGLWEDGIESYVAAAENLVHRIGKQLGLSPGSSVLDVACGTGAQDLYLARAFGPLEIDALDVTWQHVERARRRTLGASLEGRVRFHHGSATELPFPGGSFTHVMSIEGPEHFRTRRRFFAEALRVLRPGGAMALADYTITREPRGPLERAAVDLARRLWRIPKENLWTAERYRDELREAGFTLGTVEEVGALTFPGYFREQSRPAFRTEMRRHQGTLIEAISHGIDVVTNRAYERGLVNYVLVRAVKPDAPTPA